MSNVGFPYDWVEGLETSEPASPAADPWQNGRYAAAAIAWGLVALIVLGLGAGP